MIYIFAFGRLLQTSLLFLLGGVLFIALAVLFFRLRGWLAQQGARS